MLLVLFLLQRQTPALDIQIEGDRLTLNAHNTPLKDILLYFVHAGVEVNVDPALDITITGSCENMDIDDVLNQLLEKCAHVLVWDVIPGPVGSLPKLSEIRVFTPGAEQNVRPLKPKNGNLNVTRGPTGQGPAFVEDEILIGFKQGITLEQVRALLAQIGGTVVDSVPDVGVYQIRLPPGSNILALIDQLKNNSIVSAVEPNYVTSIDTPVINSAIIEASQIKSPTVQKNAAAVAILDTGLMSGLDLSAGVIGQYDALDPSRELNDSEGHGTQMALIATGAIQPAGAVDTEGAPILAIRAFDDNGNTSNFALMRSLDYAAKNGARVANLSWGTETSSEFIAAAISYAQKKGMAVVASAGNKPTGKPVYPSAYPGVIAVSALDNEGSIWSESNYGDNVAIAAPGMAQFPIGKKRPPGTYGGTSISSAYVSKTIANYFTKYPKASVAQAQEALYRALSDGGAPGKDPYYGYGKLDKAALQRLNGRTK